uniref:Uncharacterized protein n=1 Tax=Gracilaria firma TaxID=2510791 RepID=A0A1P8D6K6_9FLOR|nr:hypothetical protein [Gracilaria firma]APR74437.1 hypothetical protein [Gracilaria firma]
MHHSLKKHRLSSKKFFIVYPQVLLKNGHLIKLSSLDIKNSLCPIFETRQIEAFVIYEQSADLYYSSDYFCTFILLKMIKNIVNPDILDVQGINGHYSTVKMPVFDKCNICNAHYFDCLDDFDYSDQKSNNKIVRLSQNDDSLHYDRDIHDVNNSETELNFKDKLIHNLIVAI